MKYEESKMTKTTNIGLWNKAINAAVSYFWLLVIAVLGGVAFNVFLTAAGL